MTFTEGSEHSPDRDRQVRWAADLDRAPAHLRAGVLAAAGAHRGRALPGRVAAADDRHRGAGAAERGRSGRPAFWRTWPGRRAAGSGGLLQRARGRLHREGPRAHPVLAFTPAATLPAHPTALGRALLAFCPSTVEMTIMRGLRPYTPHTVTSPDRFRRALAVTRLTRVAVIRWELEAGAAASPMPVFGPGGEVAAAIEVTVRDLAHDPAAGDGAALDRHPEPVAGAGRWVPSGGTPVGRAPDADGPPGPRPAGHPAVMASTAARPDRGRARCQPRRTAGPSPST